MSLPPLQLVRTRRLRNGSTHQSQQVRCGRVKVQTKQIGQVAVVVLVVVASQDAIDASSDHLQDGVDDVGRIVSFFDGFGESLGQADLLIELPDG